MKSRGVFLALLPVFALACADAGGVPETGTTSQALSSEKNLYLRCNATSWDPNDSSRLTAFGYQDLALTYDVKSAWMLRAGDTCSLTATDVQNGWGAWHSNYASTFNGVGQKSLLGSPSDGPVPPTFRVEYPFLGRYQIAFSNWEDSFRIALAVSPAKTQAVIGEPVAFGVQTEDANLTYQWQTKRENEPDSAWLDVPGATGPRAQVKTEYAYMFCQQFRVQIASPTTKTVSATALLINQLPPPVFSLDLPAAVTVVSGSPVTLDVVAEGASYYRWMRNGEYVEGGAFGAGHYTSLPLGAADDGATYSVEAVRYAGNHQCTRHSFATSSTTTLHILRR